MKITVINGTEKHGITWRLKEIFLEEFRERAEITEYDLPKDCPSFCIGCTSCFLKGEDTCKDAAFVQKIADSLREAELIVMTSPAYVFHATGAMKALLDHLGYLWMPHRPAQEMFGKRAVIITQCLGAGAKAAADDIKHSLSWWGISEIKVFAGKLMENVFWDELTEKKRSGLTRDIKRLSEKMAGIDYAKSAHASVMTRIIFLFCRMLHKKLYKEEHADYDTAYWEKQGWLGQERPWKKNVAHQSK